MDSALPVVCTYHRRRCWTRLDGDNTRQNLQARRCQWISACLLLGPPSARGYAKQAQPPSVRVGATVPTVRAATPRPHSHGRPCSGFRCFKANSCRNSALFLTLAVFVVHPSSQHTHIAALLHHQPIHCPSVQLSPLSLWSICTREPRSSPSLTSSGKFIFFQLTSIYTERANDSLRVIWVPPLYSTSYGSSKISKLQS
jgi:hypothetical protein